MGGPGGHLRRDLGGAGVKLLALVERYPPALGSDRRIFELLRHLGEPFGITLLVLPPSVGPPAGLATGQPDDRFRVVRLGANRRVPVLSAVLGPLLSLIRAVVHRPVTDCDVVLANYPSISTGIAAWAIARLQDRPLVVDFCDLISQYTMDLLGLRSPLLRWGLYRIQAFLLSQATGIILATERLSAYLPRAASSVPRVVIPNGADPGDYPMDNPPQGGDGTFRLVYAGRYEKWAGSGIIESLASELYRRKRPVEIIVAGAERPGYSIPGIQFLGMRPREEIPRILAEADAVLVPFPKNATSDSASPLKLFEAWAAGRPTLASDIEGVREVARHNVDTLLLPAEDAAAWADAIELLMDDKAIRERLGLAAREAARAASWEGRAQVLRQFLANVIGPDGKRRTRKLQRALSGL